MNLHKMWIRGLLYTVPILLLLLSCAKSDSPIADSYINESISTDSPVVDTSTDVSHEQAPPCGDGESCPPGQTCCPDGRCYNLTNDPANCGECGKSCYPKGNMCIAGNCSCNGASPCSQEGYICCSSGGCLDPRYDRNNCGECARQCTEGQDCIGGVCGGTCEEGGCPEVPHGRTECIDGKCVLVECEEGYSDGDGEWSNGCECPSSVDDNGGPGCDSAYDLGELHDTEPGDTVVVEGYCSAVHPEDWYRFTAVDDPDDSCDNFHIEIKFISNPGESYVFDVIKANCTSGSVECENDTEYIMAIDTREGSGEDAWGECPCSTTPEEGKNLCMDNSSPFFVVVKLAEGVTSPGCEPYRLEISNGKYDYHP